LEGLFQCFIHHNNIPYSYIFDAQTKRRADESKKENINFAQFLMSDQVKNLYYND